VPLGVLAAAAASSSSLNDVEPGVLGFLIVAGMGVALVFLLRSMNKQFRKITPEPGPDASAGPAGGESADGEYADGDSGGTGFSGGAGVAGGAGGAGGPRGGVPRGRQAVDRGKAPK
jgi:hypothetical protein